MRVRLGRAGHPGRPAVADAPYRTPRAYDLLDVPAAAGHRVLLQWERLGFPLGPVLAVPAARGAATTVLSAVAATAMTAEARGGITDPTAAWAGARLRFFVAAGSTASLRADLADLGFTPEELDLRAVAEVVAAEAALPPLGSPRWVRAPETERAASYPPAALLLGSLAYACRRPWGLAGEGGRKPRR